MRLKEAVDQIWQHRKYTAVDTKQIISHLNEEVAESLKALIQGNEMKAKAELEDALSCMFIALKVMDIDPEQSVTRQIERMQERKDKIMLIKQGQEVELQVDGRKKGTWSIWGDEDLEQAYKLAKDLGFTVKHI